MMQRIRFWTVNDHQHILGIGNGRRIIYNFTKYNQFAGFVSYEDQEETYGFGIYENYCTDFAVMNRQHTTPGTEWNPDMETSGMTEKEIIAWALANDVEIVEPDSSKRVVTDKLDDKLLDKGAPSGSGNGSTNGSDSSEMDGDWKEQTL